MLFEKYLAKYYMIFPVQRTKNTRKLPFQKLIISIKISLKGILISKFYVKNNSNKKSNFDEIKRYFITIFLI